MSYSFQNTQTIYGYLIRTIGCATSISSLVFDEKKELVDFITTKDSIAKNSTFKMVGKNENDFIEVPDDESICNKMRIEIFEMSLQKTKKF